MNRRLLFLLLLSGNCAVADNDVDLYETVDESRLGRIFLSATDRQRLERLRGIRTSSESMASSDAQISDPDGNSMVKPLASKPRSRGKGMIVSGDRSPLVWVDGKFRRQDGASVEQLRSIHKTQTRLLKASQSHGTDSPDSEDRDVEGSSDKSANSAAAEEPSEHR